MPADARLCALPHLYLDGGAGIQIILVHAEPSRRDLHDGAFAVAIEILVQSALTGVVEDADLLCRARKAFVRVIADRAVAHGGEHHRHGQHKLRREGRVKAAVRTAGNGGRLLAEKPPRLHRLAQRVDGRVGDLGGVDENTIPIDRQRVRIAHGGQEHAARRRLLVNFLYGGVLPVGVLPKGGRRIGDLQSARRANGDAALAVDAFFGVTFHQLPLFIIEMDAVCTFLFAHATACAKRHIPPHRKIGGEIIDRLSYHQNCPSFTRTMTGSPAGAYRFSAAGSSARIAASSLATNTRSFFSATTMERSFRRSQSAISPPSKPKTMEKGPVTSSPA